LQESSSFGEYIKVLNNGFSTALKFKKKIAITMIFSGLHLMLDVEENS